MVDYSNPKTMKQVVKEAEQSGIFAVGINPAKVTDVYILKLNKWDAITLDMFNDNEDYGYKLVQIDFQLGLSSLIKQNALTIKEIKETMFSYIYELQIETIKDESERAWDKVNGKPLIFYFQDKNGYITIIKPKSKIKMKINKIYCDGCEREIVDCECMENQARLKLIETMDDGETYEFCGVECLKLFLENRKFGDRFYRWPDEKTKNMF